MRRIALPLTAVLISLAVACGGDDGILKPETSTTPVATATPYIVLPNVIMVSGSGSGGSNGGGGSGTGTTGGGSTSEIRYVVQSGDTLIGLATRYDTTVEAIMTRNNIASASDLRAGQELFIPSGQSTVATPTATPVRTPTAPAATATATARATGTAAATATATGGQQRYTVQSGDLAGAIAVRFGVTLDQLASANNRSVASLDELSIGDVLIIPAR